jgi:hypothetical protein
MTRLHRALAALVAFLLLAVAPAEEAAADLFDDDFQIWMPVIAQVEIVPDTLKAWLELQPRLVDDGSRLGTMIYRPGLGYYATPWLSLWGGYAFVERHAPVYAAEHRAWEQVQVFETVVPDVGLRLGARLRLEQRWLHGAGDDVANRLRLMVRGQIPLGRAEPPSLLAIVWDEIFVGLDETDWGAVQGVDRNRAFAGFGFQAIKQARLEVGYMLELVRRPHLPDDVGNHALMIALWIDIP